MPALHIVAALSRVVARRWVVLLALWIGAVVARDLILRAAAELSIWAAWPAAFVVSLAMLVRLTAFVAMLLVVKEELDGPDVRGDASSGPGDFVRAVLGAAIPFSVFYFVSGLLDQDYVSFTELAAAAALPHVIAEEMDPPDIHVVGFNLTTGLIVLVCLGLRIAWGRLQGRLAWWVGIVALLLEVVWTFFTQFAITDVVSWGEDWLAGRQVAVWAEDARAALEAIAEPLATAWDVLVPVLWEAILVPVAWLVAAAAVYGRELAAEQAEQVEKASQVQQPAGARATLTRRGVAIAEKTVDAVAILQDAIRIVRRTGPVLLAAYCVLFALIGLAEPAVLWLITRLVGPYPDGAFPEYFVSAFALIPTIIVTPILIALVASACDLAVPAWAKQDPSEPAGEDDPLVRDGLVVVGAHGDADLQVPGGIGGHEEGHRQLGTP